MKTAKECLTTHLPNQQALKIDGTRARGLYLTMNIRFWLRPESEFLLFMDPLFMDPQSNFEEMSVSN